VKAMRVDDYCHAVIRSTKVPPTAQAVLWAIAHYVNRKSGETFVSLPRIAGDTGIAERQVRHWTGHLVSLGVFDVRYRPGRSSIYRFPLHPALSTPLPSAAGVSNSHPCGSPQVPLLSAAGHPCGSPATNQVLNPVPECLPSPSGVDELSSADCPAAEAS
jgi:hypothetical protein